MGTNIGNTWRKPATKAATYAGPAGPVVAVRGRPGIEVHHSVTAKAKSPAGLATIVRSIWRYHVLTKGWLDVFYGYLIGSDGSVAEGRGKARGTSSKVLPVTICLVGDFTSERPTKAQLDALFALRASLMRSGVGAAISFHRDRGGSSCPGNGAVAAVLERAKAKPAPAPKPAPKPPAGIFYTVRGGDTFSGLALRYYGGVRWTGLLHAVNLYIGATAQDPNRLDVGQVLFFPDTLPGGGPHRR